MFERGSFVLRLIGVLLLVGLMIGGGVIAYRAGVAQGISQAPVVAEALSNAAKSEQPLPAPAYGYGYGYPYYSFHPHFGFFPFGGIFGIILFFFLFFGLLRLIFFRPWGWHYGHMHGRDSWKGYYGPWGPPPWAREDKEGEAEAESGKENK
jgi:hypothetical protein